RESWRRIFFALVACSWVPHWSCHYYRLETGSSFAVGSWDFSRFDSALALVIYSGLILACLLAVVRTELQRLAALFSSVLHITLGALHTYRLVKPFRFEVFGYPWPQSASLREAIIVIPLGVLCLWIARQN